MVTWQKAGKETTGDGERMSAKDTQIGGNHYKDYAIQPADFIHDNQIPWLDANIIKYVVRHRKKNGLEDLKKARHYLDMLIEKEYPQQSRCM